MGYDEDSDISSADGDSGSGEDNDHDGSVGQDSTIQKDLGVGATAEDLTSHEGSPSDDKNGMRKDF